MHIRKICLFVCAIAVAGFLAGCGRDSHGRMAISGQVDLYGVPLESGAIEFHPLAAGGTQSGGVISEGEYSIREERGLTPGSYRVRVLATEEPEPLPEDHMPGDDLPPTKSLIPPNWSETIELTKDGPFEFNFNIGTKSGTQTADRSKGR